MFRFKNWVTEHRQAILIFLIIFLLVTLSFGLGFLAGKKSGGPAPIIIQKAN